MKLMSMSKRKALVRRCEIAIGELGLSSMTKADRRRLYQVEKGLRVLDNEQADAKGRLDDARAEAHKLRDLKSDGSWSQQEREIFEKLLAALGEES